MDLVVVSIKRIDILDSFSKLIDKRKTELYTPAIAGVRLKISER